MSDTFYVKTVDVANSYGINVISDDINSPILNAGENGLIKKDEDGITIIVSPHDSVERQRFTIAHEIGHYVSGHLENSHAMYRDANKTFSQDNYDYKEYEANKYAADLLMPKDKLEFLLNKQNITTVEGLAKALVVSVQAMNIRLKNLGWIS